MKQAVIVLDCGATNIRAVAINESGEILSQKSYSNNTQEDPDFKGGLIWDVEEIWGKLIQACKFVMADIRGVQIAGVCTTTFGVDGAPFDKNGKQLYPVISWACQRTKGIIDELHKEFSLEKLYQISGVNSFHFNTLYKLYWLRKYRPEIIENMDKWLFMPAIISNKLSGANYTDVSMMGTSMLGDLQNRQFSEEILSLLNIDSKIFPELKEAGQKLGEVNKEASVLTGIPQGAPVFSAGHDTQFAIFGSGAKVNEAVLSSGTWEILMLRSKKMETNTKALQAGITTEFDAESLVFNPGIQWVASGVLEWIKNRFYSVEKDREDIYDLMVADARKVKDSGLCFEIDFLSKEGAIKGLSLQTSRGEIYLAALKALAKKTKESLQILENQSGVKVESLLIVGGGSKNQLWNQLRAQELGIEIKVNSQTETTVLGAAMFAFAACGVYQSAEDARNAFV
jgi:L-fuculokinase